VDVKRKYYKLSVSVVNHIKIEALKENISEHALVNRILSEYNVPSEKRCVNE